MTSLVDAAAMEKVLRLLDAQGLSQSPDISMFVDGFGRLIRVTDVWEIDKRWTE